MIRTRHSLMWPRPLRILIILSTILIFLLLNSKDTLQISRAPKFQIDTRTCKPKSDIPRVALINRHFGAGQDFNHVATSLNFNYTKFDPTFYSPYGPSKYEARLLNHFADYICDCFDTVVVIDTNPDARFLLERIDREEPHIQGNFIYTKSNVLPRCGVEKVVIVSTNRFDYIVPDENEYFKLLTRLQERNDGRITYVSNNPWEERYAHIKMKSDILKVL